MVEGLRHASYDLKVKRLPELQSARIRADDEVELHASVAVPSCVVQRVQTHRACNAATRRIRTHHVAAIADVLAGASLIGTNVIRAGDLTVSWGPLLLGSVAAGAVGWVALQVLLAAVRRAKLHYFSIYCWIVGALLWLREW